MPLSKDVSTYVDCKRFMDRALESPNPLRMSFHKPGDAKYFRQRCYKLRILMRQLDAQAHYDDRDINYGRSEYDALSIEIEGSSVTAKYVGDPVFEEILPDGTTRPIGVAPTQSVLVEDDEGLGLELDFNQ